MHTVSGMLRCTVKYLSAVLVAVALLSFVPQARAQNFPDALNFFKNYFVTGDYTVGGVGLRGQGVNGWATGTIYIDSAHKNQVPGDAVVVAAFLYWEAIEATDQPSTMNGYFQGYPIVGLPLQPTPNSPEGPNTPPCWSSGGGTGSSNGSKHLRVYRADVAPFLIINGVYTINTPTSSAPMGFQVMLQDSGSNGAGTPLTEGASLVIVYRSLSAGTLKSVVFYDGAWTLNNAFRYMSQTIQGFYEAKAGTAKITHIVGDGQANFGETVTVSDGPDQQLSNNPFTGAQGFSWDNTTFTLNVSSTAEGSVTNPLTTFTTQVLPNASSFDCLSWGAVVASTPVVDSDGDGLLDVWEYNQGYSDQKANADGTHDWIALPGAKVNQKDLFVQVDYLKNLGTANGEFLHSHLPKYSALSKIGNAFANSGVGDPAGDGVQVHFDVGPTNYLGSNYVVPPTMQRPDGTVVKAALGGNSIDEDTISCSDGATLCQFPYPAAGPGVVWWKGSLNYAKAQFFEHGRKDSYHYVLVGHALGLPSTNFAVPDKTLTSISVNSQLQATITVSGPVDPSIMRVTISGAVGDYNLNGTFPVTNASGTTITVNTTRSPTQAIPNPNVTVAPYNSVIFGNGFNIPNGLGIGVDANNNKLVDEPNLVVSYGSAKSTSGFSDLGGGDSLVTLGLWSADDPSGCQSDPSVPIAPGQVYCNNQVGSDIVQAGTIMHEIGHTLFLTHGGFYYNTPGAGQTAFGQNCKPNFLSVMNYLFQIRGLPSATGALDPITHLPPSPAIDYSGQMFPTLSEAGLIEANGIAVSPVGTVIPKYGTRFYTTPTFLDNLLESVTGNHLSKFHCDGTPANQPYPVKVDSPTIQTLATLPPYGIDWNNNGVIPNTNPPTVNAPQDINFDGTNNDPSLTGYTDWPNLQMAQIGSRRNLAGFSVDIESNDVNGPGSQILGGGSQILGGGSQILGGGSQILGGGSDLVNGGSQILGGGSQILGGGSQILGGGSQILGGGLEVDFDTVNKNVDAPIGLIANSPAKKTAYVQWNAPLFGQIRVYYVWRADISKVPMGPTNLPQKVMTIGSASNTTPPPACPTNSNAFCWNDTGVKSNSTYLYFVTAALGQDSGANSGNQSGPSNMVPVTVQ